MVIKDLLKNITQKLRESGNDNPVFEAHQLVRHVTGLSATDLVLRHNTPCKKQQIDLALQLTDRRLLCEPLQYILGTQEFMSLEFNVTPNVLIPRADTETLVEYVLDKTKNKSLSLLDIGTGTGCIPLSIAFYNKNAFVRGLDISTKATELARKNANKLQLLNRADFELCDILKTCPNGKYDVITSNPPYIETEIIQTLQKEVRDFEPTLALDGGIDGLTFYKRICDLAPSLLYDGGLLAFEIGYNQGKAVSELMQKNFENVEIIKDLCGNDRVVAGYKKTV